MQVELLYLAGCPSRHLTRDRLTQALAACGHADLPVREVQIDPSTGVPDRFAGSPTITLNGTDLFQATGDPDPLDPPDPPAGASAGVWACRLYPTPSGLRGAPTVDDLIAALTRFKEGTGR